MHIQSLLQSTVHSTIILRFIAIHTSQHHIHKLGRGVPAIDIERHPHTIASPWPAARSTSHRAAAALDGYGSRSIYTIVHMHGVLKLEAS